MGLHSPAHKQRLVRNHWQDAIIRQLDCLHLTSNKLERDPDAALNALLHWTQEIALDPAVSSAAQALIDKGRAMEQESRKQAQIENEALKERLARVRLALMLELRTQGWVPPQAAPVPAPSDMEDPVMVPRGLIGAACSAIDFGRDAPKTLAEMRRYTIGDRSRPAAAAPEPVGHWDVAQIMGLASEYARLSAKANAERLYGTSASYTAQCTKQENEAHAALFRALSAHPAPAVAATVQALTDALRMIAWSNDSAWQAQCAREALEAHGIPTPAAPKGQQ